jgi:hypothetical protein
MGPSEAPIASTNIAVCNKLINKNIPLTRYNSPALHIQHDQIQEQLKLRQAFSN